MLGRRPSVNGHLDVSGRDILQDKTAVGSRRHLARFHAREMNFHARDRELMDVILRPQLAVGAGKYVIACARDHVRTCVEHDSGDRSFPAIQPR